MTRKCLQTSLYCCCVLFMLFSASQGYTPLATILDGAPDEQVEFIFWQEIVDNTPVTVSIYSGGTPDIDILPSDPAIDEFEAMELGLQAWEQISDVQLQFDIVYTSTHEFNASDGENVIFFDNLGNVGYGGMTIITFDTTTGQILDADIHLNDYNISWYTSLNDTDGEPTEDLIQGTYVPGEYRNDIQGLTTHEVGHLLGLGHSAVGFRESADTPTMYPLGIWNVPGEGNRPPNSYYRSIEPDDYAGIQVIYNADCSIVSSGLVSGVVHDDNDDVLFGAHIVARDLNTNEEIGCMSGVVRGPYTAGEYELFLPSGIYELRTEPIDGSPPGYVGPYNFGGIANSLCNTKFGSDMELTTSYYKLVHDPADATPVTISLCDTQAADFRPVARMKKLPHFVRIPKSFNLEGSLNTDITGPLSTATLTYTVNGINPVTVALPTDGSSFVVPVDRLTSGSIFEYVIEVETVTMETFSTIPQTLQMGLSGDSIVLVSKNGAGTVSAVDTGTMFEIDEVSSVGSYPVGLAYDPDRYAFYTANYGSDTIVYTPLWDPLNMQLNPQAFDTDGDGLLDVLESSYGTLSSDPDTDGDLDPDGSEISEFRYTHPDAGPSGFEVLGGTVANDGVTPIGFPTVGIALWNVTTGSWASSVMDVTESGRFRLTMEAGITFHVVYYNRITGFSLGSGPDFTGSSGTIVSCGVTQVNIDPPDPPVPDSGSNPLDPLFTSSLFFMSTHNFAYKTVNLVPGADPWQLVFSPDRSSLYISGYGTSTVYKLDTLTDQISGSVPVDLGPVGIDCTPDGSKLYVCSRTEGEITVIDTASFIVSSSIVLPGDALYTSITGDGLSAVATIENSTSLAFIDVATDTVDQTLDLGFSGLYFLGAWSPDKNLAISGPFQVGTHELAVIDIPSRSANVIDLGTGISATAGLAVNPDGLRGYAIHYMDPQLLEFDIFSGTVLRTCDFGFIDIRDIALIEHPVLLRDDSIDSLDPPPDLASVMPIPVYKDPAPQLPFTDEPGLLTDDTRPLVLYNYLGVSTIYLYKDMTPGIESVRIEN